MNKKYQNRLILWVLLIGLVSSLSVNSAEFEPQGPSTVDQCRGCHDDYRNIPSLKASNADLHHYKNGDPLDGNWVPYPNPSVDVFNCLSCHAINASNNRDIKIITARECIDCHGSRSSLRDPGIYGVIFTNAMYLPNRHHQHVGTVIAPEVSTEKYSCPNCHSVGVFSRWLSPVPQ